MAIKFTSAVAGVSWMSLRSCSGKIGAIGSRCSIGDGFDLGHCFHDFVGGCTRNRRQSVLGDKPNSDPRPSFCDSFPELLAT